MAPFDMRPIGPRSQPPRPATPGSAPDTGKSGARQTQGDRVVLGAQAPPTNAALLKNAAQVGLTRQSTPVKSDSPTLPLPEKQWTVLHYSAADNNLQRYMFHDLNEMEAAGSSGLMNIVAQFDKGGREGASRYFLTKDPDIGAIHSPALEKLGSVNMSSADTLANFIEWGEKNFPARHTMLIMSDHGDGWRGVAEDDSHGGWMDLPTLKEGLAKAEAATGKKIDIMGFDACLMAQTEVAHELKDHAGYLVGSEELEGGDGWPYTQVLTKKIIQHLTRQLSIKSDLSPEEFARDIVTDTSNDERDLNTLSAIDLSKMGGVAGALDRFAGAILAGPTAPRTLRSLASDSQGFNTPEYRDAIDFASRVATSPDIADPALKDAAKAVVEAASGAVMAEHHDRDHAGAHGISIDLNKPGAGYANLDLAKQTRWTEAMKKINS